MNRLKGLLLACMVLAGVAHAQSFPGQAIATQYGQWRVQGYQPGNYAFPSTLCRLTAGKQDVSPIFATNAPVKIVDPNPAMTEVVTPHAVTYNQQQCAINISPVNFHNSFVLQSATCGLQEAINAQQGLPAVVVITPDFNTMGCNTATITSAAGNSNVPISDQRSTPFNSYQWNGSAYVLSLPQGIDSSKLPLVGGSLTGTINTPNAISKLPITDVRHPDFVIGGPLGNITLGGNQSCTTTTGLTITIDPPVVFGGTQAVVVPACTASKVTFTWRNYGGGYTTIPNVTISGGGTSGATATASLLSCTPGQADPSGVNPSSCALMNAAAFAEQGYANGTNPFPMLYIPGTYTLDATIRLPNYLKGRGDGFNQSFLLVPSNTSYNGVTTFKDTPASNTHGALWLIGGGLEDISIIGGGHTSTGNGLELDNCVGCYFSNVLVENFGGRCVQKNATTERSTFINIQANACRLAWVDGGEQDTNTVINLQVAAPLINDESYSWNVNAVNGVFPASGSIKPDRHCGVVLSSYVYGLSVKTTQHGCAVSIPVPVQWTGFQGFYLEGFSGGINAGIQVMGKYDLMTTTSAVSTDNFGTYVQLNTSGTNPIWWRNEVTDPQDVATTLGNNDTYMVACPDFSWTAAPAPCAANPAIQTNQYEFVTGTTAGSNGRMYFLQRNQTYVPWGASTAPANSNWPAGSQIQVLPNNGIGAPSVSNGHLQSDNGSGGGYTANCSDSDPNMICGEVLLGPVIDGIMGMYPGTAGYGGPNLMTNFKPPLKLSNTTNPSGPGGELVGQGWPKCLTNCTVEYSPGLAVIDPFGENGEVISAQLGQNQNTRIATIDYPTGQSPSVNFGNGSGKWFSPTLPAANPVFFWHQMDAFDSSLGTNPQGTGGVAVGDQFASSYCTYDTPSGIKITVNGTYQVGSIVVTGTGPFTVTVNAPGGSPWLVPYATNQWIAQAGWVTNTQFNGNFQVLAGATTTSYSYTTNSGTAGTYTEQGNVTPHAMHSWCMEGYPTRTGTGGGFSYRNWTGTTWNTIISYSPDSANDGNGRVIFGATTATIQNGVTTMGASAVVNFPVGGTAAAPQFTLGATNTGFYGISATSIGLSLQGNLRWILSNSGPSALVRGSGFGDCWSTTAVPTTTVDTCIYRSAANNVRFGNGSSTTDASATLWFSQWQPGILYSAAGTPLPTCNAAAKGLMAVVSDATAPTYNATYASGGAVVSPVMCNGTNWTTH